MKWIFSLAMLMLIASCSSTRPASEAEVNALEKAVNTPEFKVSVRWALPLDTDATQVLNALQPAGGIVNGNRVNLDGGYTLQIVQDSIEMYLPYFGERRVSGGISGNTGIDVKNSYTMTKPIEAKNASERILNLQTNDGTESYDMNLRLFATGKASLNINSSHRQSIQYEGTWE